LIVVARDHTADTVVFNVPGEESGRVFAKYPGRDEPKFLYHKSYYESILTRFDDLIAKDTTASS
jgi:hypothetical protein